MHDQSSALSSEKQEQQKDSSGGDPSGSPHEWFNLVIGSLLSVGGIIFAGVQYFLYREREDIKYNVNKAVVCLSKSHCKPPTVTPYVKRKNLLLRLNAMVHSSPKSSLMLTTVICGARGTGKSTIIQDFLQEQEGVVQVQYSGDSDQEFAAAVLDSIGISAPKDTSLLLFLMLILQKLTKPPTFVVELDRNFDGKKLGNLLLLLKQLGDDKKLAKSIVILSLSRAALTLEINVFALRARFFNVYDLMYDESEEFLRRLLEDFEESEEEKKRFIDEFLKLLGNRLLDLHEVGTMAESCSSLEQLLSLVRSRPNIKLKSTERAFKTFTTHFPNFKKPQVLDKITNGRTLYLDQLSKELNTSEEDLVEKNAAIEPHLLYIDPYTTKVCLDSHFVNVFVNMYLQQ